MHQAAGKAKMQILANYTVHKKYILGTRISLIQNGRITYINAVSLTETVSSRTEPSYCHSYIGSINANMPSNAFKYAFETHQGFETPFRRELTFRKMSGAIACTEMTFEWAYIVRLMSMSHSRTLLCISF